MEDIHEMMLQNGTWVSNVPMTTVLIQMVSFLKGAKSLKVDTFLQNIFMK